MLPSYALMELFAKLATEVDVSYSVALAFVLIAAGLRMLLLSRRAREK